MRIATAQNIITSCIDQNALQIEELIKKAAQDGADFIHFPEGALSGYVKAQISNWSEVNWKVLEENLNKLQNICATNRIGAAIGSAYKDSGLERPFNSMFAIDDTGAIIARYDKRFCSNTEINNWYSAGTTPTLIDIKGMKLGFALCIEVQFPEIFMEYERLGADCVLLSAYNETKMFKIQAQGHAACNNYWVSYSVPENVSHTQASCFIGPDGTIIKRCENGKSGFIVNKINPDAEQWDVPCKKARPWRRLARKGEIYKSARN
jgi:deaminated glutathione amidase